MESYIVTWANIEVGQVSQLQRDMWYLDGSWASFENATSKEFEKILTDIDPKMVFDHWDKALRITLSEQDSKQNKIYCLALFLGDQTLSMRQLIERKAIEMFFPGANL